MARPHKTRKYCCTPDLFVFKPKGIPIEELEIIEINHDEFEAIKHSCYENMDQIEVAAQLNVSQPTYNRILNSALKKLSSAIIEGKAIKIAHPS